MNYTIDELIEFLDKQIENNQNLEKVKYFKQLKELLILLCKE